MVAREDTRGEIIRKGAELIHVRGYNATGIQQILQSAGIPKGSFYFYFKSKEDFCLAVIDHFTAVIGEDFRRFLDDKRLSPIKRFEALFEYYESIFIHTGGALGCPIGNLSLELADASNRLRERLKTAIEALIDKIASCLEEARQEKSIPEQLNVHDAARFIFQGFEGAILHMKVSKSIEPFQLFRRYVQEYLHFRKH
ncbi:MAG: Transcriptional regulator AcuR [Syntrophus sp. SKADARSKE-3]|nr:Transcriptional regulator AcuR [Syntrophus sp. SKADARSKE-3]